MFTTVLKRGLVSLTPIQKLLPDLRIFMEIAQQALPATSAIMSVALGFFVTTYFLKSYGESTVAAFGVTTRIEQMGVAANFWALLCHHGAGWAKQRRWKQRPDPRNDANRQSNRVCLNPNDIDPDARFRASIDGHLYQ